MKKLIVIFVWISMFHLAWAQDDATIPGSKSPTKSNTDLPKTTFFINPLGILQFGPVFSTEHKLGNSNGYLSPHLRWSYLGVLSHLAWEADYLSPANLGVGLSYRAFIPSSVNNNAFYFGGGLELNREYARFDSFGTEEYFLGLGIIMNAGYRWRFQNGRFVNVGLIAGVVNTIYDEEYYFDGTLYATYSENPFIGMFEFSFGWEKSGK
ncbi:MAG: hypothetical protein OEW75_04015 [Cyclobacteriaceae bacterium]|nr:hypothetical protein [Cyclobacteriaceae bacterium]